MIDSLQGSAVAGSQSRVRAGNRDFQRFPPVIFKMGTVAF